MVKRIVVLGPESTGKSMLCSSLAKHYNTEWVREYAREYLTVNGSNYTYEDLSNIGEGQIKSEDDIAATLNDGLLFIDTDLHVMKTWSEFVFNKCDIRILNGIAKRRYDLYLLTDIDLPWQADDLREYPDYNARNKLFHHYHEAMVSQSVPYEIISGFNEHRTIAAIHAVKKHLSHLL
jgi:NadR type nicotinamide-nucleotide adenylyltransferase